MNISTATALSGAAKFQGQAPDSPPDELSLAGQLIRFNPELREAKLFELLRDNTPKTQHPEDPTQDRQHRIDLVVNLAMTLTNTVDSRTLIQSIFPELSQIGTKTFCQHFCNLIEGEIEGIVASADQMALFQDATIVPMDSLLENPSLCDASVTDSSVISAAAAAAAAADTNTDTSIAIDPESPELPESPADYPTQHILSSTRMTDAEHLELVLSQPKPVGAQAALGVDLLPASTRLAVRTVAPGSQSLGETEPGETKTMWTRVSDTAHTAYEYAVPVLSGAHHYGGAALSSVQDYGGAALSSAAGLGTAGLGKLKDGSVFVVGGLASKGSNALCWAGRGIRDYGYYLYQSTKISIISSGLKTAINRRYNRAFDKNQIQSWLKQNHPESSTDTHALFVHLHLKEMYQNVRRDKQSPFFDEAQFPTKTESRLLGFSSELVPDREFVATTSNTFAKHYARIALDHQRKSEITILKAAQAEIDRIHQLKKDTPEATIDTEVALVYDYFRGAGQRAATLAGIEIPPLVEHPTTVEVISRRPV
jgi:hypothetical protein